ncbi:MAG: tetratricopeptide repeat-containing glycosyltransferase family 2 protein [Halobacteriota archaeon]
MRVSATLIVRDESAFIDDCLASLVGFVDEIVLVDTGSRDDTVRKALRFPINLHSFRWRGNFSAARNYAITHASGEWILYIDADERLEVPDRDVWNDVRTDTRKAAWKLRFYPRVGWTPYSELRLFRNDSRIRFRGVIHERVYDDVEAVCHSDGCEIGSCEIILRHFGYENDQRPKLPRNIPMLRAYVSHDPERVYCWWHLGDTLQLSGDEEGAIEAWRKGIQVARSQVRQSYPVSNSLPYLSLILLLQSRGIPVDDLLHEALSLFPQHLFLQWVSCKLALERGHGERVRAQLERLAAIDADSFYDPEVSYKKTLFAHACRESLALCHFRASRFKEAAYWFRQAARAAPDPHACEVRAQLAQAKAGAGAASTLSSLNGRLA